MESISVLLVDDHQIFMEGIESLLRTDNSITVAGKAYDYDDLFNSLDNTISDIILLDAFMPGHDAIDTLTRIGTQYPDVKVILLSGNDEEVLAREAFDAGAMGYLLKSAGSEELAEAIHTVHSGRKYICSLPAPSVNETILLDPDENRIVKFLSEGLSYKEVGEVLKISTSEVEAYTTRILQKLHLTSNIELVKFAIHHKMIEL